MEDWKLSQASNTKKGENKVKDWFTTSFVWLNRWLVEQTG